MLSFISDNNPKKVLVVPETELARVWFAQLPKRAKRIRKGCEKFAIQSFELWKQGKGTYNLSTRISEKMETINKEIKASNAADPDSQAIVKCSAFMKHLFKVNLKQSINKVITEGSVISVQLRVEGITAQGSGATKRQATARAARAFVRGVEKQAKRQKI